MSPTSLYEKDFYAWTLKQAELIKKNAYCELDMKHLLEEVESMGASEVRELESRMEVLLMHLLKWKYQPAFQSKSWQYTIDEQRHKIKKRLKKMPALKYQLNEIFVDGYDDAIYSAVKDTGLDKSAFPKNCEWTVEQVLDDKFFPA